jgi:hypothetical protein
MAEELGHHGDVGVRGQQQRSVTVPQPVEGAAPRFDLGPCFPFSLDLSHQVSGRGSRTLNPRAAADLARFIRRVTGGMDSNWLHLLVTGRPRRLAELVLAMEDRKNR